MPAHIRTIDIPVDAPYRFHRRDRWVHEDLTKEVDMDDVWTYPDPELLGANIRDTDVTGYGVEALDGSIGKIDEATYDTGSSYLIVDTGSWLSPGKKVMLPAGVVLRVTTDEKVYVNRMKDEIKDAPELEDFKDEAYLEKLGGYYGPGGPGYRDLPRDSKGRFASPE